MGLGQHCRRSTHSPWADILRRGYKGFDKGNFRHNLAVRSNKLPKGMEAHHVLPQSLDKQIKEAFPKMRINVHDPKLGAWVKSGTHQGWSKAYEKEVSKWLAENQGASWKRSEGFLGELGGKHGFKLDF